MEKFKTNISSTPKKIINIKSDFSFLNSTKTIYNVADRAERFVHKSWFDYLNSEARGMGMTKDIDIAHYNECRIHTMAYFKNL